MFYSYLALSTTKLKPQLGKSSREEAYLLSKI
jgi:hypothetical protein